MYDFVVGQKTKTKHKQQNLKRNISDITGSSTRLPKSPNPNFAF